MPKSPTANYNMLNFASSQGRVTVQFMNITIDLQDFSRKNVYQMVETTAYFEAYSPILEGLKLTKDSDLPFQVSQY